MNQDGTGASAWLGALANRYLQTDLTHAEFTTLFRFRLGLSLDLPQLCIAFKEEQDPFGHHAVVCRARPGVTTRHNALRDSMCAAFRETGLEAEIEKEVVTPGVNSRPADAFGRRDKLCIDTSVSHPGAKTYLSKAANGNNYAGDNRAKTKNEKYRPHVQVMGLNFTPFVIKTWGSFQKQNHTVLNVLANHLASKTSIPLSVAMSANGSQHASTVK